MAHFDSNFTLQWKHSSRPTTSTPSSASSSMSSLPFSLSACLRTVSSLTQMYSFNYGMCENFGWQKKSSPACLCPTWTHITIQQQSNHLDCNFRRTSQNEWNKANKSRNGRNDLNEFCVWCVDSRRPTTLCIRFSLGSAKMLNMFACIFIGRAGVSRVWFGSDCENL